MAEQVAEEEGPRGQGHCPAEDPVTAKVTAIELLKNSENVSVFMFVSFNYSCHFLCVC